MKYKYIGYEKHYIPFLKLSLKNGDEFKSDRIINHPLIKKVDEVIKIKKRRKRK